jgi:hypothetical protein
VRNFRSTQTARASACAVIALALVGCVTPPTYGPIGHVQNQYGYRDNVNADGSHRILVVAASAPMAHEFWDRRAAEICGSTTFEKNIFRAQRPIVQVSGYVSNGYGGGGSYTQDAYGDFMMEGYLRCTDAQASAADAAPAEAQATSEQAPAATTP